MIGTIYGGWRFDDAVFELGLFRKYIYTFLWEEYGLWCNELILVDKNDFSAGCQIPFIYRVITVTKKQGCI